MTLRRPMNRLLRVLPDDELARVASHLQIAKISPRELIYRPGEPVRRIYFPEGGVFSVTRPLPDGSLVEAAPIGSEGMIGIEACFSDDAISVGQTFVQVPDGVVVSLPASVFRQELDRRGTLHKVVGRYVEAFLAMVIQCAACNALHDVQGRCARCLLLAHDRMRRGEFRLSHEALAIMLGASRPTVTVAALRLQDAGLISYRHGRMQILNRHGLEDAACVCYGMIERHFERVPGAAA